jgi:hypothetical protein
MGKSEDYRRNAVSCLQLVDKTNDPAERAYLLEMARAWHNLADQSERNSAADLVYETPPRAHAPAHAPQPPPDPQQPVTQQQQQIQPKKNDEDES